MSVQCESMCRYPKLGIFKGFFQHFPFQNEASHIQVLFCYFWFVSLAQKMGISSDSAVL